VQDLNLSFAITLIRYLFPADSRLEENPIGIIPEIGIATPVSGGRNAQVASATPSVVFIRRATLRTSRHPRVCVCHVPRRRRSHVQPHSIRLFDLIISIMTWLRSRTGISLSLFLSARRTAGFKSYKANLTRRFSVSCIHSRSSRVSFLSVGECSTKILILSMIWQRKFALEIEIRH